MESVCFIKAKAEEIVSQDNANLHLKIISTDKIFKKGQATDFQNIQLEFNNKESSKETLSDDVKCRYFEEGQFTDFKND